MQRWAASEKPSSSSVSIPPEDPRQFVADGLVGDSGRVCESLEDFASHSAGRKELYGTGSSGHFGDAPEAQDSIIGAPIASSLLSQALELVLGHSRLLD